MMTEGAEDRTLLLSEVSDGQRCTRFRDHGVSWFLVFLLLVSLIIVVILVILKWPHNSTIHAATGHYRHAAVAADAPQCAAIGKAVLHDLNGSAVDAAIATLLCLGVHNAQSCGVGGGFFMVVYDVPINGSDKTLTAFDAREEAPGAATEDMFMNGTSSVRGGKSIAVPGELLGYYKAWQMYGRLTWKQLFQPTIDLCRNGFEVDLALGRAIAHNEAMIRGTPSLQELFVKTDGTLYAEGDMMTRVKLADTLERVAGVASLDDLWNGVLSDMVADIQDHDGIVTIDDFRRYKVKMTATLNVPLRGPDWTMHSLAPPSAGVIYSFILRLLEGFNLTSTDIASKQATVETYHKFIESFKYGYALRTYLGDSDFVNNTEMMSQLTSQVFIDSVRSRMNLSRTQAFSYYGPESSPTEDGGTSHLSLLAANGGAVAATSTINNYFGSQRVGRRTGVIFNDEMDDFSRPGPYDPAEVLAPSRENLIAPGKRPMSSMSPSIFLDAKGNVVMVIGASGGSQITTATSFVTAHALWLGKDISEAVDQLRLHDSLLPDGVVYEAGFSETIKDGLKAKGHVVRTTAKLTNVVQAIYSTCHDSRLSSSEAAFSQNCITAVCDGRKGGKPDGY